MRQDFVLVAIADAGVGLAADKVERLFEAFFTTKPNGLGVGLAICRSIVEAHGGRLWVSPNAPCGAILQFTLPAENVGSNSVGIKLRLSAQHCRIAAKTWVSILRGSIGKGLHWRTFSTDFKKRYTFERLSDEAYGA